MEKNQKRYLTGLLGLYFIAAIISIGYFSDIALVLRPIHGIPFIIVIWALITVLAFFGLGTVHLLKYQSIYIKRKQGPIAFDKCPDGWKKMTDPSGGLATPSEAPSVGEDTNVYCVSSNTKMPSVNMTKIQGTESPHHQCMLIYDTWFPGLGVSEDQARTIPWPDYQANCSPWWF
jgi:hypothetical protein